MEKSTWIGPQAIDPNNLPTPNPWIALPENERIFEAHVQVYVNEDVVADPCSITVKVGASTATKNPAPGAATFSGSLVVGTAVKATASKAGYKTQEDVALTFTHRSGDSPYYIDNYAGAIHLEPETPIDNGGGGDIGGD